MNRSEPCPRLKIVAIATAASLGLGALAGCGAKEEFVRSCYGMPYVQYSDEITKLTKQNVDKYDNVTNRITAAMITYLGIDEATLTEKFDGWVSTSSITRSTIGKKYAKQGLEISSSDLPRNTDYIAFDIRQRTANLADGGQILPLPDGVQAFKNSDQLRTYAHNTGGFSKIDCITLEPTEVFG